MYKRPIEAPDAPAAVGGYSQAVEVTGAGRWLYVSGQVPIAADGSLPVGFEGQCRQAWANLFAQLCAADMGPANLVKVTTFLARREDAGANRAIRNEMLAGPQVALTVILPTIFDEAWLIEIEAVAAA
jgi:2-iminobutanoate/2-iminopropanoate deaminase